jgi:hypothetical protein
MMKVNLEDVDEWVSKGWTRDEPAKRMSREVAPDLGVAPAAPAAPAAQVTPASKPPKSK